MEEPDDLFYADDYLLFPGATKYFDHTGPEVRQAFRPFFHRAVQALRTENPANAARWVGALLHFVQDAGCPPHAAGLRGDAHTKMETWIDVESIRIPGHQLRAMGNSETEILDELLRRLDRLTMQAEERGRRLRVAVEIGNRSAVRPVVMESALECARLTADLLHALGPIANARSQNTGSIRGSLSSRAALGMERFPAKIVLEGTMFSTLADSSGRFEFRNLPASNYTVMAFRPGSPIARAQLTLKPNEPHSCNLVLPTTSTNLVLNPDFKLAWISPPSPDYWYQTKTGWEGEPILLKSGQPYRLVATFKPGAKSTILARWTKTYEHAVPRYKIEPRFQTRILTPGAPELLLTGGADCGFLHLTIRGRTPPASGLESIRLEPVSK